MAVQFSCIQLFATSWTAACQAFLSITNSREYSRSWPLGWWCHPTISSSAIPFSSCLQVFPASRYFPMNQFFTLGGQSIGVSVLLFKKLRGQGKFWKGRELWWALQAGARALNLILIAFLIKCFMSDTFVQSVFLTYISQQNSFHSELRDLNSP